MVCSVYNDNIIYIYIHIHIQNRIDASCLCRLGTLWPCSVYQAISAAYSDLVPRHLVCIGRAMQCTASLYKLQRWKAIFVLTIFIAGSTIDTRITGRSRVWTDCSYTGLAYKDAFAFSSCSSSHIGLFSASPAALVIWNTKMVIVLALRYPGATPWWHGASCARALWWPIFLAVWRCPCLVLHPGVACMMTSYNIIDSIAIDWYCYFIRILAITITIIYGI